MKFTEEQYHEIIKAWESQSFSLKRMQAVIEIMSINDDMPSNIKEGLALANPASREWAHEQFVEEEKRYAWTLKKLINVVSECVYTKNILEVFNHFFL